MSLALTYRHLHLSAQPMTLTHTAEPLDSAAAWSGLALVLGGADRDVVRNTLRHLRVLNAKSYDDAHDFRLFLNAGGPPVVYRAAVSELVAILARPADDGRQVGRAVWFGEDWAALVSGGRGPASARGLLARAVLDAAQPVPLRTSPNPPRRPAPGLEGLRRSRGVVRRKASPRPLP